MDAHFWVVTVFVVFFILAFSSKGGQQAIEKASESKQGSFNFAAFMVILIIVGSVLIAMFQQHAGIPPR